MEKCPLCGRSNQSLGDALFRQLTDAALHVANEIGAAG
jgi:hypothetical protein